MKRVFEQLTAYYTQQGLAGDDLSTAVADDVRRVKRQAVVAVDKDLDLSQVMVWAITGEGHAYWGARHNADANV